MKIKKKIDLFSYLSALLSFSSTRPERCLAFCKKKKDFFFSSFPGKSHKQVIFIKKGDKGERVPYLSY
jgi:hypothetical protein